MRFSDAARRASTAENDVDDLHALLAAAHIGVSRFRRRNDLTSDMPHSDELSACRMVDVTARVRRVRDGSIRFPIVNYVSARRIARAF
jgi:hypothetical protein